MMNLTGRCGQVCAEDGAAVDISAAKPQRAKAMIECRGLGMDYSCDDSNDEFMNGCARSLLQQNRNVQRMHICANGISVGGIVGVFPPLVMEFSQIHSRRKLLHCRIRPNGDLLSHTIKRLLPPFPPRMTGHENSACPVRKPFRSEDVFC
jgi:hypothetical protein